MPSVIPEVLARNFVARPTNPSPESLEDDTDGLNQKVSACKCRFLVHYTNFPGICENLSAYIIFSIEKFRLPSPCVSTVSQFTRAG